MDIRKKPNTNKPFFATLFCVLWSNARRLNYVIKYFEWKHLEFATFILSSTQHPYPVSFPTLYFLFSLYLLNNISLFLIQLFYSCSGHTSALHPHFILHFFYGCYFESSLWFTKWLSGIAVFLRSAAVRDKWQKIISITFLPLCSNHSITNC